MLARSDTPICRSLARLGVITAIFSEFITNCGTVSPTTRVQARSLDEWSIRLPDVNVHFACHEFARPTPSLKSYFGDCFISAASDTDCMTRNFPVNQISSSGAIVASSLFTVVFGIAMQIARSQMCRRAMCSFGKTNSRATSLAIDAINANFVD